jgi:ABC-type Zn uptake system ZnuABC Zn-binding protein ZnuA
VRRLTTLSSLVLVLAGCATSHTASPAGPRRLRVLSSVAPLTNIAENIAGNRVDLSGLIPEGVDSHTFEPSPETARLLSTADVVFLNGLHLEDPTLKLAEDNRKPGSEIVLMGDQTISPEHYQYDFSFPKEKGDPNPHLWMDPIYASNYARIVADTLSRRDPTNESFYRSSFERFSDRVRALDTAIRSSIDSIPNEQKKLVTYHDSFAYFSLRYHIPVIGAIQASDFKDPTPKEVASLIDQIRREHVPAIFGSEVFPSTVLEQIARESGAKFIDKLRDDELPGGPSDRSHTYLGLMIEDVRAITDALGGNSGPMSSIDPTNVTSE